MAPRRMDGFARSPQTAAPRPAAAPAAPVRPVPQRPAQPAYAQPQPAPQPRPQAYARPQQPAQPAVQPQAAAQRKIAAPKGSGGWKLALQFIAGLLVIAGVAAAIVMLYLKYYTQ